jgi:hypothetical protein
MEIYLQSHFLPCCRFIFLTLKKKQYLNMYCLCFLYWGFF